MQPPGHQLRPVGLETEDSGPSFGGWPISEERSHSMNKKKTYLYNIIQGVTPSERHKKHSWKDDEGLKELLKTAMKIHTNPLKIQREGMKVL